MGVVAESTDRLSLAASRRRFVNRLLLPRGRELATKWALIPVGAVLAIGAREHLPTSEELVQLTVLWFIAEQLVYQARYQVNDLRDRLIDARHPAAATRGRLDFPWSSWRARAIWGSLAVRLTLALLITTFVLEGAVQRSAAWFLVIVAVSATAYEVVRERTRREAVPPLGQRARHLGLPVLLIIPIGYGLRVWAGFYALTPSGGDWSLYAIAVSAVVLLFASTTLLAWALEGTALLWRETDGRVESAPALGAKPHIALLLRHTGVLRHDSSSEGTASGDAKDLVLARDRPVGPGSRIATWDITAPAAVLLAYSFVAVGTEAEGLVLASLLVGAAVSATAPLVARRMKVPSAGPWNERPSWLGGGALSIVVLLEVASLLAIVLVQLLVEPTALRLTWFVAWTVFQWGAMRASSYSRGFGPLSLVRRPLLWWHARVGRPRTPPADQAQVG